MKRRGVAILISGVLGAGCSLAVALDGYTGGSPGTAPAADASPDVVTPPPGPTDGGVDAVADAGPTRRCDALRSKNTTVFCEDFDGPTPLSSWSVDHDASVDPSASYSPAASLLVTTPALDGGTTASAYVYRDLAIATRFRISWMLFTDGSCSVGNLTSVGLRDNNGVYFLVQTLFGGDGSLWLQEYGQPGPNNAVEYSHETKSSAGLKTGSWQRIAMEIDLSSKTATLYVDDAPVLQNFAVVAGYGIGPLVKSRVAAGLSYVGGPMGACRFHFDDVAVETF